MNKVVSKEWASVKDGFITIAGKSFSIKGFRFVMEVGRGANAVVFEAIDEYLNRKVAIKVWNPRGVQRAQFEAEKIAQFNHPLIVTTYQFGLINDQPYSVMEFVPGSSGKDWLKEEPAVAERVLLWQLFSKALRFIHDTGEVHGDPHLGNVLVFSDDNGYYVQKTLSCETGISIKLADAGTSKFWTSDKKILIREGKLIFETAGRLFKDQNIDKLWFHPPGLSHQDSIQVLDVLCEYVSMVNGFIDCDRKSQNAEILVDLLIKTPLFELEEIELQIKEFGYTTTCRFARRLNKKLLHVHDVMAASDIIDADTKRLYSIARQKFIGEHVLSEH